MGRTARGGATDVRWRASWTRSPGIATLRLLPLLLLQLLGLACHAHGGEQPGATYPLFLPEASGTKLIVQREGLDFVRSISGKVAIVSAIGPYRTGKSFLLNQLMGVTCNRGFGVGNLRSTMTKGIWLWGEPEKVVHNDEEISVVFMDTEGMQGTGRTNVYDDRIFALASMLSSVLIYNLPETVKESDIQKLSFAVELSEEFFRRLKGGKTEFAFPTLFWLIQRDFLEGEGVQKHIEEVLAQVDNAEDDPHVDELNRIRKSLSVFEQLGVGLRQPHLDRTKLCNMTDAQLDPRYIEGRDELRLKVREKVSPKVVASSALDGPSFADFAEKTGQALNERELPSVASVIDVFNQQLVEACLKRYISGINAAGALPQPESKLLQLHAAAQRDSLQHFAEQQFGSGGDDLLKTEIQKARSQQTESNKFASLEACDGVYNACDEQVQKTSDEYLLSRLKFEATFQRCNASFITNCVGPSQPEFQTRLQATAVRATQRFAHDYHERILGVLLTACFVGAVTFRFLLQQPLLELVCWVGLATIEVGPRLTSLTGDHKVIFESEWWPYVIMTYEMVVFNPVYDLATPGHAQHVGMVFAVVGLVWRLRHVTCLKRLFCCFLRPCKCCLHPFIRVCPCSCIDADDSKAAADAAKKAEHLRLASDAAESLAKKL